MDDAVRARDAAREALADIDPESLRSALRARLDDAPMTPAILTLRIATALSPEATGVEDAAQQAVGVQLIYEGLRLTRELVHDEPWAGVERDPEDELEGIEADLEILAADVLVSRGFYLLARTEAAERAVAVVRSFGRDQTARRAPDADAAALDRNLETDAFALAAVAGAAAVGRDADDSLVAYAADLAVDPDEPPEPPAALPADFAERVADRDGEDRLPSSAADS